MQPGIFEMVNIYEDWRSSISSLAENLFGKRSQLGTYSTGGGNYASIIITSSPGGITDSSRMKWKKTTNPSTGNWNSMQYAKDKNNGNLGSAAWDVYNGGDDHPLSVSGYSDPHLTTSFDSLDHHLLSVGGRSSSDGAMHVRRFENDPDNNWQMMAYPPLI